MIHVPTAAWAHGLFDVAAWSVGGAVGYGAWRWRLRAETGRIARMADGGYFAALLAGPVPGAFLAGSLNAWRLFTAVLSHSIVGALVGAVVGVEAYKAGAASRDRPAWCSPAASPRGARSGDGGVCSPGCRTSPTASPPIFRGPSTSATVTGTCVAWTASFWKSGDPSSRPAQTLGWPELAVCCLAAKERPAEDSCRCFPSNESLEVIRVMAEQLE